MNKFTSWETHFPVTKPDENFHGYEGNKQYHIKSNSCHLYISQCIFSCVTETTIHYSTTIFSNYSLMLVEHCSFNKCSTSSSDGGAIFYSHQGQSVLSFVCGVKCNTDNRGYGQFCYVYVSEGPQYKNYIIDSSITLNAQTNTCYTLYHKQGDVSCKGVNVSNNEVYIVSGIYIESQSLSSISFSSFRNNNSTNNGWICIYFSSRKFKFWTYLYRFFSSFNNESLQCL